MKKQKKLSAVLTKKMEDTLFKPLVKINFQVIRALNFRQTTYNYFKIFESCALYIFAKLTIITSSIAGLAHLLYNNSSVIDTKFKKPD